MEIKLSVLREIARKLTAVIVVSSSVSCLASTVSAIRTPTVTPPMPQIITSLEHERLVEMKRVTVAVSMTAALAILCGCASSDRSQSAGTSAPLTSQFVDGGRQKTVENFPALGIKLEPPLPSQLPKLTELAAYNLCGTPALECGGPGTPTVAFALMTTDNGGAVNKDATVTPLAVKRPAFVLRWPSTPCTPVGGARRTVTTSTAVTSCLFISLVDAVTGKALGSAQTNHAGG